MGTRPNPAIPFLNNVSIDGDVFIAHINTNSKVQFNQVILQDVVLESSTNPPNNDSNGMANKSGRLIYNTINGKIGWWNGTTWVYPDTGGVNGVADTDSIDLNIASSIISGNVRCYKEGESEQTIEIKTDATKPGITLKTLHTGGKNALITYDKYGRVTQAEKLDISNKTYTEVLNNLSVENKKIINLADPTDDLDAVNLRTLMKWKTGFQYKEPVEAVHVGNLDLFPSGTIDGVTITAGKRYLFANQTPGGHKLNGIWSWNGASWQRESDMDEANEIPGALVVVKRGTTYADTLWLCVTDTVSAIATHPQANGDLINITELKFVNKLQGRVAIDVIGTDIDLRYDSAKALYLTGDNKVAVKATRALSINQTQGLNVNTDESTITVNAANELTTRHKGYYFTIDITPSQNGMHTEDINILNLAQTYLAVGALPDVIAITQASLINVDDSRFPANTELEYYKEHIIVTSPAQYTYKMKFSAQANKTYRLKLGLEIRL